MCLNCKISRCFKVTAHCLSCIHCLTKDSLKGRFNSVVAKNLHGSGRKDCTKALLSFWCVVELKQTWVFLSSEPMQNVSTVLRTHTDKGNLHQVCASALLSETFFGLELLKTQEGKGQKFFCSVVNSETRMFAFHTLFLRTT